MALGMCKKQMVAFKQGKRKIKEAARICIKITT